MRYEEPIMEILEFEIADIVTTSTLTPEVGPGGVIDPTSLDPDNY